jgi:tryptophan-rich sensory protein
MMKRHDIGRLVGSIAACQGAGAIGAYFTTPQIDTWYATLTKPAFMPPNAVFMPVWLTLYTLMAIAVFLIWRQGVKEGKNKQAFTLFWVQLGINAVWSVVFFGLQSILGGFVIIVCLWVLVLMTMLRFFKISLAAGALLTPYLAWLSIASGLNAWLWVLNG